MSGEAYVYSRIQTKLTNELGEVFYSNLITIICKSLVNNEKLVKKILYLAFNLNDSYSGYSKVGILLKINKNAG